MTSSVRGEQPSLTEMLVSFGKASLEADEAVYTPIPSRHMHGFDLLYSSIAVHIAKYINAFSCLWSAATDA